MRIIAGRLRRRTLLANPGLTTRPIIHRAKVMLFDYIRDRMPGAKVADLFCGTGTLGFEALSRGASRVVFAERDHRAHEYLVKNAAALKVTDEVLCWRVDVARCSLKPQGQGWYPYDVVFFDPPYVDAAAIQPGGALARCITRLTRPDITSPNVLLVFRTPVENEYPLPAPWNVIQTLEVASMRITLAEKNLAQLAQLATESTLEDESPAETASADETAGDDPRKPATAS